jgi:hypothetical protein
MGMRGGEAFVQKIDIVDARRHATTAAIDHFQGTRAG